MKKTISILNQIVFFFLFFLFCNLKSFSQSNVIYYGTYGGDSYKAEIVKSFTPGDIKPQLRFRHTQVSTGASHYEDFIDYVSDAGERWRATVHYNYVTKSLYFRHCRFDDLNQCHNDVIMNIKDFSGCSWTFKFENCSEEQVKNTSHNITLAQTLIACPKPSEPNPNTSGSGGTHVGSPRYTVDKPNGGDWVVRFITSARVLFHAGSGYYPASIIDRNPGDQLIIKPGQWAQVWVLFNGSYVWSLMSDADHR